METETRIRLLIFTPTLRCGGSEKFVSLLCNNINTELFSVSLVVLDNSKPFYAIKNPGIEVIDLKKSRVRFALFKLKRIIKKCRPDIVLTTANHLNLYLAIFRWAFPKATRFLARESSIVSVNSQRTKMPGIYNWLIKKFYHRFDLIICQSVYMQQDLVNIFRIPVNKTAVIHNATEENIRNKETKPASGRKYKFITVARLSEEKGVERLIHAVGLVSLPFEFYIIGDGNRRVYLQMLVQELEMNDKIYFTGECAEPFSGMEEADLFLMGSYYEGSPNVLIEAGALGIPVIAFDVPGGISEIITAGENGILVEDNDIIAFAAAVRNCLSVNFDKKAIIETTLKRFSVNTVIAGIENILLKLN